MLLGVAGRRPKYWWDLGQGIDSDLGGLLGTHVRSSDITYTDPTTKLITTLGNNQHVHEMVGGHLALRIEPEGTNLIHYSHELGDVASGGWWSDEALTGITANEMLGPDGTVEADGLVANVSNVIHNIYTPIISGVGPNEKIALTVFGKKGNKDWVKLRVTFYGIGNNYLDDNGNYYFNLATGAIGSPITQGLATIHSYKIEPAANGFYEIGMILSNSDPTTAKVRPSIYSAHDTDDDDFTGDGSVNTWLWGADLKKDDTFSSYVPTSGGTITRATESGSPLWDLPLGLFDDKGTCSVWVRFGYAYDDVPVDTPVAGVVVVRDAAFSLIRARRLIGGEGKITTQDGTTTAFSQNLNWAANTWYKAVAKWGHFVGLQKKFRIGVDIGAGIVWGDEEDFDLDGYTQGANLRLAFDLFGPMWLRDLRLHDYVRTDTMINADGSPP